VISNKFLTVDFFTNISGVGNRSYVVLKY